ncbi:MAG: hypothetical protein FI684_02935 [SAR202 cluster bacterium]|nr:hypothetical protein [SAR202 cluster bacterium]
MSLIELEVSAGENSPLDLHRMYNLLQDPVQISIFESDYLTDEPVKYAVTGWSEDNKPCPAQAAQAEDSGDGVILLIYGGTEGIRIQRADDYKEWNISDPSQWGEPCLMLDPKTTSL